MQLKKGQKVMYQGEEWEFIECNPRLGIILSKWTEDKLGIDTVFGCKQENVTTLQTAQ